MKNIFKLINKLFTKIDNRIYEIENLALKSFLRTLFFATIYLLIMVVGVPIGMAIIEILKIPVVGISLLLLAMFLCSWCICYIYEKYRNNEYEEDDWDLGE